MNVAYLVLKTAHNLYGKNPGALAGEEMRRVESLAARQFEIEARVLASDEARDVVVPEATLEAAMAEVRNRYQDLASFQDDLAGNGLSMDTYRSSLERELKVEAVLDKVGSRAARVSDIDVELYYRLHPEQFQRPETRVARHILLTINPDLPGNSREEGLARMQAIELRLRKDPSRFEEQALKHSECPTAMNGGLIGPVTRGQLYPELDQLLFEMDAMTLSPIVESSMGWHLLRCDQVNDAGVVPIHQVREKIRVTLMQRRKRVCQQAWLQARKSQ